MDYLHFISNIVNRFICFFLNLRFLTRYRTIPDLSISKQILGIFESHCTISKYEVRSEKIKKVDENRDSSCRENQDAREKEPEQATRHDLARITLLLHANNTSRSSIRGRSRSTYDGTISVARAVRRVLYKRQPRHLFAGT